MQISKFFDGDVECCLELAPVCHICLLKDDSWFSGIAVVINERLCLGEQSKIGYYNIAII